MKFQNQFNREQFMDARGEKNSLPSATVPDQDFTVDELITRHSRGLFTESKKIPVFDGDDLVPDFAKMDFIDRKDFIQETKAKLQDLTKEQIERNNEMSGKSAKAQRKMDKAKQEWEQSQLNLNKPKPVDTPEDKTEGK